MAVRSEQLQIRVTPREKASLKRLARAAGQDVSAYVLSRVLPLEATRFEAIIAAVHVQRKQGFALAELSDLLSALVPAEFESAVASADLSALDPPIQNYVAAMVEHAARTKGVAPPRWARDIAPLDEPYFATPLRGLWPHLLQVTPVAFKRRNVFTDTGVAVRI